MELRKAIESDINKIMEIIIQAQNYFKENKIDQWQDNYPNENSIKYDIFKKQSYILIDDGRIVAVAALCFGGEKNYNNIYEGKWVSNSQYAAIHRIAVDNSCKGKGLATEILKKMERICIEKDVHSIKIDTHKQNKSMQKLLEKNDYEYCGIIYLENGSERIAFEKII